MRGPKGSLRTAALAVLAALLAVGCAGPGVRSPSPAGLSSLEAGAAAEALRADTGGGAGALGAWTPGVHEIRLLVDGQEATGLLAVPKDAPAALVVVAHGWRGDAAFHRPDLERIAEAGALAVAMDYRGPASAFKVRAGVEDTVAATLLVQQAYPDVERTLLYGWSMGGEVALLAPMEAPPGTYDYVFAGAGVTDLAALWSQNPAARPAIERETGGAPVDVAAPYSERSPVARAAELAGLGIQRVFLVHGLADPVVPVDHAERMYDALAAAGVPVSYYVVTRDRSTGCDPVCLVVAGPGNHLAGRLEPMWPFLEHRIAEGNDPSQAAVRGTYDAYAGTYEPPDR
jgi:dienelactone hydrolase